MLSAVLDLLAPPRCVVCARRAVPPWCDGCARAVARLAVSRSCPRCGAGWGAERPHGCWRGEPPVDRMEVAYRYRGPVARTVLAAKLRGAGAAWEPLGAHLAARLRSGSPARRWSHDAVTWIPTEPGRRRARGLDHAARLARGVARGLGLPVMATLRARPGLPDQGRRPTHRRARLPRGAYRARGRLEGRRLLLVDDVVTTGATLDVAAGALRAAGADVSAALLARAGDHPLGRPGVGGVGGPGVGGAGVRGAGAGGVCEPGGDGVSGPGAC